MADVAEAFVALYGEASTLTNLLKCFALTESQKQKCAQRQELTDNFVLTRRQSVIGQGISVGALEQYSEFCKAAERLLAVQKSDVFSVQWYRYGRFGSLLFLRESFRELYALLGPRHTLAILCHYVIFEQIEAGSYVQWTGDPASAVAFSRWKQLRETPCTPATKKARTDTAARVSALPTGVSLSNLRDLKRTGRKNVKGRKKTGDNHLQIGLWPMLYVTNPQKLQSNFLLGQPGNLKNARKLALKVFPPGLCSSNVVGSACLLLALRQFLKNHRSCRYHDLLEEHCPREAASYACSQASNLSKACESSTSSYDSPLATLSDLSKAYESSKAVTAFLHAVLRRLLPSELLGTRSNLRHLIRNVATVATALKGEVLSVVSLAVGIKVNHVPWLARIPDPGARFKILHLLVAWCARLALTILACSFYVTESRKSKRLVLFYRRTIWNSMSRLWIDGADMLSEKVTDPPSVQGFGRLLPKGTGDLRLLVTVKESKERQNKIRTLKVFLNSLMKNVLDIYTEWKEFVQDWRDSGRPRLYLVKTDIEDCFHSIDHKVALDLLNRAFEGNERERRIVAFTVIKVTTGRGVVKGWVQHFANDIVKMPPPPRNPSERSKGKISLLVPKMCLLPSVTALKQVLCDYLGNFQVHLNGRRFLVTRGIVQGGTLSCQIADVYLAAMQDKHLSSFGRTPGELLLRSMDDFLFVTPSEAEAASFMDRFLQGFPDFGLRANVSKIETNLRSDRIPGALPREHVQFCGFIFDAATLEVFEEHEDSIRPGTSMTRSSRASGADLKTYLEHWQIPLRPLVLDSTINSRERVLATLFVKVRVLAGRFFFAVNGMRYVNGPYVVRVLCGVLDFLLLRLFRCATATGFKLHFSADELRLVFWDVVLRNANGRNKEVRAAVRTRLTDARKKVPISAAGPLADFVECEFRSRECRRVKA
ncbi:unnamed protein product [Ixodes hexagonus]